VVLILFSAENMSAKETSLPGDERLYREWIHLFFADLEQAAFIIRDL